VLEISVRSVALPSTRKHRDGGERWERYMYTSS
jgi:hypothetical protein